MGESIARLTLDETSPSSSSISRSRPTGCTAVRAGGRVVPPAIVDGHIVVPAEMTSAGANEIEFEFVAGDEALNRNDEFLYTLFVPARAQLAFPCFDQPDLKARYTLTLDVPDGWQAVANGSARRPRSDGRQATVTIDVSPRRRRCRRICSRSSPASSRSRPRTRDGRTLRMFHRETDAAKVARNRDAIFDLHAHGARRGSRTTPPSHTHSASSTSS